MHNKSSEILRQPIEEDPMSEDLDDSGSGDVTPHLPGPVGVMVGFPLNVHSDWNLHGWHLDDFSFRNAEYMGRIVCKVRTQDPENFHEEVKSLVTACWLSIFHEYLPWHQSNQCIVHVKE